MLSKFGINNDEIVPVCVMATMSSGKSTFLNAILGDGILPEKNEACTARVLAILNKPNTIDTKAYIYKNNGEKYAIPIYYKNTISKINDDENISDVLIIKDIPTLMNSKKSIVLFDTPGVNNSGDLRHAEITQDILKQLKNGVIVYILNATQLATNDDELLLQMVVEHLKKNKNIKIIFVLNKIDMLDEDKESILGIMETAYQYITDHGINEFTLFPLSALSAKTFRMKLNEKSLTKTEQRHMNQNYCEYKNDSNSMLKYVHYYNQKNKEYLIDGKNISEYDLRRAIENTGIVEIEREIERLIISQEYQLPKNIDKLKNYFQLEGVYSRKRKSKNIENYSGEVFWICKNCKQVNGTNDICLHCKKPNIKWTKAID